MELNLGNPFPHYTSPHLTADVFTVKAGEDICRRIMISQRESHGMCILSAVGTISTVTLLQPNSRHTQTYEGVFDIVSLTGYFLPAQNGFMKKRTGGMTISLATSDGTIFGGGIAGTLIAASPIQVVVGSFYSCPTPEYHLKRRRTEEESPVMKLRTVEESPVTPAAATPVSSHGCAGQQMNHGSPTTDLTLLVVKSEIQDPKDTEGDHNDTCDSDGGSNSESDDDDVVEIEPPNKHTTSA